jgi:hypothetical protein
VAHAALLIRRAPLGPAITLFEPLPSEPAPATDLGGGGFSILIALAHRKRSAFGGGVQSAFACNIASFETPASSRISKDGRIAPMQDVIDIEVTPLSAACGAEIKGIDLTWPLAGGRADRGSCRRR